MHASIYRYIPERALIGGVFLGESVPIFIETVCEALQQQRVSFAVVGGYAVALHGAVRGTIDLDIIIKHSETTFIQMEKALTSIGFQSRLPLRAQEVFHFRQEYIEHRNLVAWSFYNSENSSEIVDVILTHDFSQMKAMVKRFNQTKIPVLCIDDLIQMKKASGRPQDSEDIKALEFLK